MYRIYIRTKVKDHPQRYTIKSKDNGSDVDVQKNDKRWFKPIGWICKHCKRLEAMESDLLEVVKPTTTAAYSDWMDARIIEEISTQSLMHIHICNQWFGLLSTSKAKGR
jgi:hypothetical protein